MTNNRDQQGVGAQTRSYYCQDSNGATVANSLCGSIPTWTQTCYQSPVSYNYPDRSSYTFTVPVGVTTITVDVWGGGGGGGDGGYDEWIGGGGGGGGGYSRGIFTVVPGTSYTVIVGWGGASSFGTLLTANTGENGKRGDDRVEADRGKGGAGGTGTTANGSNGGDATPNNRDGLKTHGGIGGDAGGAGGGQGGGGIDCYSEPSVIRGGAALYPTHPGGGGGGGSGGACSEGAGQPSQPGKVMISW